MVQAEKKFGAIDIITADTVTCWVSDEIDIDDVVFYADGVEIPAIWESNTFKRIYSSALSWIEITRVWNRSNLNGTILPCLLTLIVKNKLLDTRSLPRVTRATGYWGGIDGSRLVGFITTDAPASFPIGVAIYIDSVFYGNVIAIPQGGYEAGEMRKFTVPFTGALSTESHIQVSAFFLFDNSIFSTGPEFFETNAPAMKLVTSPSQVSCLVHKAKNVSILIPTLDISRISIASLRVLLSNLPGWAKIFIVIPQNQRTAYSNSELSTLDHISLNTVCISDASEVGTLFSCGVDLSGEDDVFLLNPEIVFSLATLHRFRYLSLIDHGIGSITPLGMDPGIYSGFDDGDLDVYPGASILYYLSVVVRQASTSRLQEIPFCSSLCVYITRDCIDDVGLPTFSTKKDFAHTMQEWSSCAIAKGWQHVLDDRTIVSKTTDSFEQAQPQHGPPVTSAAMIDNIAVSNAVRFNDFSNCLRMKEIRWRLRRELIRSQVTKPRILTVISSDVGGTPQSNRDMIIALYNYYEFFLLNSDGTNVGLWKFDPGGDVLIAQIQLKRPITLSWHASLEYDAWLLDCLLYYNISLVHIRHISRHSTNLPIICSKIGVPTVYSLHDYYCICPSFKLLDHKSNFCGGVCTSGPGICKSEIWSSTQTPYLKHNWVKVWQEISADYLSYVDAFVTTSTYVATTVSKIFPSLCAKRMSLIPHGREFAEFAAAAQLPDPGESLRLLAPGNLSVPKGSKLLSELCDLDWGGRSVELHIMGSVDNLLYNKQSTFLHGAYVRAEFVRQAAKIRPHLGLVLSIWPETHCHTLTELWAAGIPTLVFDLGEQAQRTRETGNGWVMPLGTSSAVQQKITQIFSDESDYSTKICAIHSWQSTSNESSSLDRMATDYKSLYESVLSGIEDDVHHSLAF